jgi:hypothetical protein
MSVFDAVFPTYGDDDGIRHPLDPAKVQLWTEAINVLMPILHEFGADPDEHAHDRIADQLHSALPALASIVQSGALSDDGLSQMAEAARRVLFANATRPLKGKWFFQKGSLLPADFAPGAFVMPPKMNFTKKRIQRVTEGLLPIRQLREILPHIWSTDPKQPVTLADHITQLGELADVNSKAFKLLMAGDLAAAECWCAGSHYVFTARRHAIIWLLAEIVRVARLVDSVESLGSLAHLLGPAWTENGGDGSATANVGRVLSAAESHARALNELAEIQSDQARTKSWANEKLNLLDEALRANVEGQDSIVSPGPEADLAAEWLRGSVNGIEDAIQKLEAMRSGALNKVDGTTTRPFLSFVRHTTGAAPATALAIVGLRVSQALATICISLRHPSPFLTLALPPLSEMKWDPKAKLNGHVMVAMHLCRVQLLVAGDQPATKDGDQRTNWKTVSLHDRKTYMKAKSELVGLDPYKSARQDARKVISNITDASKSNSDQRAEAERAQMLLDLSLRNRW